MKTTIIDFIMDNQVYMVIGLTFGALKTFLSDRRASVAEYIISTAIAITVCAVTGPLFHDLLDGSEMTYALTGVTAIASQDIMKSILQLGEYIAKNPKKAWDFLRSMSGR